MLSFSWITEVSLFCLLLLALNGVWGEGCVFPKSWRGRWYQNGMGEVVIAQSNITKKGFCLERHRDYYLIQNREEHCHKCLIIMRRHHNIIQYKEGYCVGKDTLQAVCAQIRVEAVLYTLVREPASPIPSPFEGAYHFTYNNNSGGFCRNPMSYVHQCASQSKFRFQFRYCDYAAYTYNKELEYECLATWKDGSDLYMYGGFTGPGITTKDDMYRCFMYQKLGTVVYISMSADATCRGLRDSRDGPLVMEFTKDVYGWPEPECAFPYWLTTDTWRDLSGRHTYRSPTDQELNVNYQHHRNMTSYIRTTYKCMRIEEENHTAIEMVTLLSYTIDQCAPEFQCIRIVKRQPNVLEIIRGDFVTWNHQACTDSDFTAPTKHLLIPLVMTSRPCPYSGRFTSPPDDQTLCQVEVTSECKSIGRLDIHSSCYSRPVAQLECLNWWKEEDKQFLIVQEWKQSSGIANCYSFRQTGNTIQFGTDHRCNHAVDHIASEQVSYILQNKNEECLPEVTEPEVGDVKQIDTDQTQDPGGGYNLLENKNKQEQKEEKQQYTSDQTNGTSDNIASDWRYQTYTLLVILIIKVSINR